MLSAPAAATCPTIILTRKSKLFRWMKSAWSRNSRRASRFRCILFSAAWGTRRRKARAASTALRLGSWPAISITRTSSLAPRSTFPCMRHARRPRDDRFSCDRKAPLPRRRLHAFERGRRSPHHRTRRRQQRRPHDAPQIHLCFCLPKMKTPTLIFLISLTAATVTPPRFLRALFSPASASSVLNPFLQVVSASLVGAQHAAPLLPSLQTNAQIPEWCRPLPRPEYKLLQRVLPDDPWFEVYKVAPGVFAIYEPHQAEEAISYLMVGTKKAG